MTRDILRATDAINQAKGVNSGLDAIVSLLMGSSEGDLPKGTEIGELIYCVQLRMAQLLEEAAGHLRSK